MVGLPAGSSDQNNNRGVIAGIGSVDVMRSAAAANDAALNQQQNQFRQSHTGASQQMMGGPVH